MSLQKAMIKAYPRRRGGNYDPGHADAPPPGLSPQARGEP